MPVRGMGRFRDLKAYWWFGIIVLLSIVLLGCGTNSTAEEALGESPTPTKDVFGSSTGMKNRKSLTLRQRLLSTIEAPPFIYETLRGRTGYR